MRPTVRSLFRVFLGLVIAMVFMGVVLLAVENNNRKTSKVVLKQIHEVGYHISLCQRDLFFGLRSEQLIEVDCPYIPGTQAVEMLVVGTTVHARVENMSLTNTDMSYPILEVNLIGDDKQFTILLDMERFETRIDLDYGFW